jgi:hypothetical protein
VARLVGPAGEATAQIDPDPRTNLELGAEGPLRGDGNSTGYAFLLWNRPHFLEEDLYLRIVFAPAYLTGELVRDRWPADGHAFGLGLGGGFFPYNVEEFRRGDHKERESFYGHGGEATFSYYRRLKIADLLPIEGQLRFRPQYVVYQRSSDTDRRFRLPADTPIYTGRVGLRVGGEPPELLPDLALELSLWYEVGYRQHAEPFGYRDAPVVTEAHTEQAWARLGGIYSITRTQTIRAFLTAGVARNPDRLSAFRLGSALPFRREFPLLLHGYYVDEIFAESFGLLNLGYRFPLWPGSERVRLQLSWDYARVSYLAGHALPRQSLRGLGVDLTIGFTDRLTLILGYGYGLDAPRNQGFGGHELNALMEFKF